jgi:hypothetical protein
MVVLQLLPCCAAAAALLPPPPLALLLLLTMALWHAAAVAAACCCCNHIYITPSFFCYFALNCCLFHSWGRSFALSQHYPSFLHSLSVSLSRSLNELHLSLSLPLSLSPSLPLSFSPSLSLPLSLSPCLAVSHLSLSLLLSF